MATIDGPPRTAHTPMAFVRTIVLAYERRDLDPRAALKKAQIAPAQLRRLEARIDADQMETLSGAAMQELDDEALGWFSRRLPWGTYGMLCRASLTAPTLCVALERWCRHHALVTDDVRLRFEAETGALTIEENTRLGAMREFCLLSCLRYLHGYACWLVDSQLPLREVTFPFSPPPHERVYPLLFPGPVRFGASHAGFVVDTRYLELAPRRDERAISTMLKRALPLTVRPYRRDRLLVRRVEALLVGDASANAQRIATALHVSVRSLHRQLGQEGASLQRIKDDVRRQRALDLLSRTSTPLKSVARQVGFRSEKSFSRAFKTWTGRSPGELRDR
ncbi:MAG: AraC family transcriptional regulator [Polyangia bacterium]